MAVTILFDFLIIRALCHKSFWVRIVDKFKHGTLTHEDSSDYRSVEKDPNESGFVE
jgi:hypothetical protein